MNFPNAVKSGIRNFVNFKGRASRSEFWWFVLFGQLALTLSQNVNKSLGDIVYLLLIIPNLSLQFRRLHDIGRSAKWMLWPVIALVGLLASFIGLLIQTSQTVANFDADQFFDAGSQFYILTLFICLILMVTGLIVNFVFWLLPSESDLNQYGPPPPPKI